MMMRGVSADWSVLNQGHFVENGCDLILRFIFLIILASRIFFTVRLLKRKKTVR